MSVRRSLVVLAAATILGTSTLLAPSASARAPAPWSPPTRIPGTVGLVNPGPAVAPDGTDLVTWLVDGSGTFGNAVAGKVRLPGEAKWRRVPVGPDGSFLGITDIAPTASGDFWMTYQTGAGSYTSFLIKLDGQTREWSKPVRLFKDQTDYYHSSPEVGLANNGTLVVSANASPKVAPPGDPVNRLVVGVRSPGSVWKNRFLSPVGAFTFGPHIAVNPAGDAVVSFIRGYQLADMTVWAATRAHGKDSDWKTGALSSTGDSQRAHPAIGPDGTAAVVWTAPSTSVNAVRMATREVRRNLAPWVSRDVVTGVSPSIDAYAVVNRRGETTVVWQQNDGGPLPLWSRHLDDSGFGSAIQLTPSGEIAQFNGLVQRPDGKAALLYQRFPLTGDGLETESRTLTRGVPGPIQVVIGDEATDGTTNGEFLGVDAASHSTMIYTRGDYPDTDFVWLGQSKAPSVMTGPTSGNVVSRARVSGSLHIGTKATCVSGYWVEASEVSYRWERNGHRIDGATGKRYRLVNRDDRERISCQVTGADTSGHERILTSPSRRAG